MFVAKFNTEKHHNQNNNQKDIKILLHLQFSQFTTNAKQQ